MVGANSVESKIPLPFWTPPRSHEGWNISYQFLPIHILPAILFHSHMGITYYKMPSECIPPQPGKCHASWESIGYPYGIYEESWWRDRKKHRDPHRFLSLQGTEIKQGCSHRARWTSHLELSKSRESESWKTPWINDHLNVALYYQQGQIIQYMNDISDMAISWNRGYP